MATPFKVRNSPWLIRRTPRDDASLRLFCFPHAGAGAVIFKDWYADMPAHVDVCAIEPPGRLARRHESPILGMSAFVAALEVALDPFLDIPCAFFGYSLGAVMAFELARALRRHKRILPTQLMVAAARAPQLPRKLAAISREPKARFVQELERRYGPIDPLIKAEPEMFAIVLEIMRVDLGLLENYQYQSEAPLECPILAIGGTEDASMVAADVDAWRDQTSQSFAGKQLPGGHFFLRTQGKQLQSLVREQIS